MAKKINVNTVFDSESMLLSKKSPFSVQEAYKTLRTNVSFSLPGSDCKCIGVVSAKRSEGKSSVSINLAISFAQLQKKVIVIDGDMRLPTLAAKLRIATNKGLSNYLAGNCTEIPVQHIEDRNLDIITSGNIPPDSTTLLESNVMADMIEQLKEEYDYIIIDLPPITVVSDAAILSKLIDGYLLVVRHNWSEMSKIDETMRQLRFADAKVLGFVYNGKSVESKYYRKRGYYKENYYYYKKSE